MFTEEKDIKDDMIKIRIKSSEKDFLVNYLKTKRKITLSKYIYGLIIKDLKENKIID